MGRSHLMRLRNVAAMWLALFGAVCFAQNPNAGTFPINDESLLVASSGFEATLAGNISASDLTLTVDDASGLLTPGAVIIDFEIVVIASKAGNVLTVGETSGSPAFPICAPRSDCRGFDQASGSPPPTSHLSGAPVVAYLVPHHLNEPRALLKLINADVPLCSQESELTLDAAGSITIPWSGCFRVDTFANAPTDDLEALICPAGARVILMAEDDARTIVIKSGAVFLMRYDQSLDSVRDSATFTCRTADVATRTGRSDGGS